jgi:RimJ/RimL family protein N-acetyltransferase
MGAAVDAATARGARKLTLRVLSSNAIARALYESCGFEVEGILRETFLLEGRYVDDVLMARRLIAQ